MELGNQSIQNQTSSAHAYAWIVGAVVVGLLIIGGAFILVRVRSKQAAPFARQTQKLYPVVVNPQGATDVHADPLSGHTKDPVLTDAEWLHQELVKKKNTPIAPKHK